MDREARSPKVIHITWGRLEVEGMDDGFKDAKLFPGGARAWDWNETGTNHEPGIQPADVEELLERGVTPEALRVLEDRGVRAHVRQTGEAIQLYNELRETERVGALIHSTC
jgi:hypothetical protein